MRASIANSLKSPEAIDRFRQQTGVDISAEQLQGMSKMFESMPPEQMSVCEAAVFHFSFHLITTNDGIENDGNVDENAILNVQHTQHDSDSERNFVQTCFVLSFLVFSPKVMAQR